jgi:putative chitinase
MLVTKDQLKNIYREAPASRLDPFIVPLNETLEKYQINTPLRIQMFLAQVGHESGQFRYMEELASGSAYENRKDLGNMSPGDGVKYKGRGLIQITGRRNYALCSLELDLPLLETPELLAQLPWAVQSAGWYWSSRNLNSYCDKGDFETLTKRINGGLNGYADRVMLYKRAIEAFQ